VAVRGRKSADAALALALAAGLTIEAAAERAGVSPRTAYRRLADPAFLGRVTALRDGMVERAVGRMAEGMADAADTLRQLLGAQAESVRLGAARSILELTPRLWESLDVGERLAALEGRLTREEGP
jgi:hypothetical protein